MNRCINFLMAALVLLGILASLAPLSANAQTEEVASNIRQFPKTAVRGELVVYMAPEITMDGKTDRLSPAVRIRDSNNNLILSANLTSQKLLVNYVRDNTGLVHQVWILNRDEARQKMSGPASSDILTNIRSMFDTPAASDDGKTPYHQLPSYK